MIPTLYLVLADDWELRGDGSGDPHQLQFKPMRELVRLFARYGVHGSFNVEVMQQLTFRRFEGIHSELRKLADAWDAAVLETFRQGHDIQLHLHPQWHMARIQESGKWLLGTDWSILNYEPDVVHGMIAAGKQYLERLLRMVDPEYRCVSFRAGAWCIAPSNYILRILSDSGIIFDTSIVGGFRWSNEWSSHGISLDYTKCQESFVPFYPEMSDARRVANEPQPIICVPTWHFREGTFAIAKRDLQRVRNNISRLTNLTKRVIPVSDPTEGYREWVVPRGILAQLTQKLTSYLTGNIYVSDISRLDYGMLSLMMRAIRREARKTGLAQLPVVLVSHTKDIRDFSNIEKFIADLAAADDVRCITLTQLAKKLTNGDFAIRTACRS